MVVSKKHLVLFRDLRHVRLQIKNTSPIRKAVNQEVLACLFLTGKLLNRFLFRLEHLLKNVCGAEKKKPFIVPFQKRLRVGDTLTCGTKELSLSLTRSGK